MEEVIANRVPPPLPPKNRSGSNSNSCKAPGSPPTISAGATVFVSPVISEVHSTQSITGTTTSTVLNTDSTTGGGHVVKIKINPENGEVKTTGGPAVSSVQLNCNNDPPIAVTEVDSSVVTSTGSVRISVGDHVDQRADDMLQRNSTLTDTFIKNVERSSPYFFCSALPCVTNGASVVNTVMSSGQCSPSDTLDSGTCSDLDGTPPPLPKKKSVTVTVIGAQHKRASSLTSSGAEVDSGSDNESNISCDSLNSSELNSNSITEIENGNKITALNNKLNAISINEFDKGSNGNIIEVPVAPPSPPAMIELKRDNGNAASAFLPQGLLKDIRDRSAKLSQPILLNTNVQNVKSVDEPESVMAADDVQCPSAKAVIATTVSRSSPIIINESTYEERKQVEERKNKPIPISEHVPSKGYLYETDKYYKFHLNENIIDENDSIVPVKNIEEDETFAGYRDILGCNGSSTIRSAKGTVRGVKNRVRAGIATFLQINSTTKVR